MPIDDEKDQKKRLVDIVRGALERDKSLRDKYKIGDKFRFIKERLQALLSRLEKLAEQQEKAEQDTQVLVTDDDVTLFVYLFNANGLIVKNWQNMISQQVFHEYSINRPIYSQKSHIEELIRAKKEKTQHAFLEFVVKKSLILKPVSDTSPKDILGNPLVKVREGALRMEKMVSFTHNNIEYILDSDKRLIKKP